MTNPESSPQGRDDRFADAVSWFVGRRKGEDRAPETNEPATEHSGEAAQMAETTGYEDTHSATPAFRGGDALRADNEAYEEGDSYGRDGVSEHTDADDHTDAYEHSDSHEPDGDSHDAGETHPVADAVALGEQHSAQAGEERGEYGVPPLTGEGDHAHEGETSEAEFVDRGPEVAPPSSYAEETPQGPEVTPLAAPAGPGAPVADPERGPEVVAPAGSDVVPPDGPEVAPPVRQDLVDDAPVVADHDHADPDPHDAADETQVLAAGDVDDESPYARPSESRPLFRDEAVPAAGAAGAGVAGAAALGAAAASMGNTSDADETKVVAAADAEDTSAADRRAARDRQLGRVEPLAEAPAAAAPVPYAVPSTYRGFPSFGFFLLRFVVAAMLGFRAFQQIIDLPAARAVWEGQRLPQPGLVTWIVIGIEIALAVMLLFGIATRIAGLILAIFAIAVPVFSLWGAVPFIQPGQFGFTGEFWVLLAVVGVLLFTTGGGRAGVDGSIHSGRIQRKNDRLVASS